MEPWLVNSIKDYFFKAAVRVADHVLNSSNVTCVGVSNVLLLSFGSWVFIRKLFSTASSRKENRVFLDIIWDTFSSTFSTDNFLELK